MSVKEGIETGPDEKSRYMRDYTEQELMQKLEHAGLAILKIEKTGDLLGRDRFRWVNVVSAVGDSIRNMLPLAYCD